MYYLTVSSQEAGCGRGASEGSESLTGLQSKYCPEPWSSQGSPGGESASKLTLTHLVVGRTEGLSGSLAVGLGPPSLLCQAGLSIGSSQHGGYKRRRQ